MVDPNIKNDLSSNFEKNFQRKKGSLKFSEYLGKLFSLVDKSMKKGLNSEEKAFIETIKNVANKSLEVKTTQGKTSWFSKIKSKIKAGLTKRAEERNKRKYEGTIAAVNKAFKETFALDSPIKTDRKLGGEWRSRSLVRDLCNICENVESQSDADEREIDEWEGESPGIRLPLSAPVFQRVENSLEEKPLESEESVQEDVSVPVQEAGPQSISLAELKEEGGLLDAGIQKFTSEKEVAKGTFKCARDFLLKSFSNESSCSIDLSDKNAIVIKIEAGNTSPKKFKTPHNNEEYEDVIPLRSSLVPSEGGHVFTIKKGDAGGLDISFSGSMQLKKIEGGGDKKKFVEQTGLAIKANWIEKRALENILEKALKSSPFTTDWKSINIKRNEGGETIMRANADFYYRDEELKALGKKQANLEKVEGKGFRLNDEGMKGVKGTLNSKHRDRFPEGVIRLAKLYTEGGLDVDKGIELLSG